MTSLPKVDSSLVQDIANEDTGYLSAYKVCLKCEEEVDGFPDKLRQIRILGFLLLHAPYPGVRSEVAKCILSCEYNNLHNLGGFFERYVILTFKKYKSRTPGTSEHPSKPEAFEAAKKQVKVDIHEAPKNHKEAKEKALIRDGWRCVATGIMDRSAPDDTTDVVSVNTQCAHIIPQSTFIGVVPKSEENPKLDYSTSVLAVLKRFNYDIDKFNEEKVHSLANVLTLEFNVHDGFDQLELYFEATSQENQYEIKYYGGRQSDHLRQLATFTTPDPKNLPVPAPELLALHATCCKVAHLSGAAEYIDEIYRDADGMDILSNDGSSNIVDYMLMSLSKSACRSYDPQAGSVATGYFSGDSDMGVY